jgi:diguanylate cyclase (GGDEF)-like protein
MRQTHSGTRAQAGADPARPRVPARSPDAAVWDIAQLLVSESSPDRVLEALANALDDLVPYDALTVFQADPALRVLRPVLCRDAYAPEILAMGAIAFGEGIAGGTVEDGTPALVNDAHLDSRALPIPGTPDEPESLIAIPLVSRSEPKGALCLYRLGESNHFTREEFDLAIRFGQLAALALDNAQIRSRLEAEVVTDHLTGLHNHRYFHERLGEEVRRASRQRDGVGLLIYDLDDFKRVNDIYGHLTGDQVLQALAAVSRGTARTEDVLCRIGGEEFAVILPGAGLEEAVGLAERLRNAVAAATFPTAGRLTVSVGVAVTPTHSSSPRDLIACADLALLDAKATGKNRVCAFGHWAEDGAASGAPSRGELRSVAHLRLLQSLAAKLNRLHDVRAIAEAITVELRGLIDYHNCRIHLLEPDDELLVPIAFRGELTEYKGETFEALVTRVGEGITGWVAEHGQPYYSPNTADDSIAVPIAGTPDVDESLLVVPLRHGDRVVGTIALSKLGIDQFDQDDMRLLEVLASHAAVALENARLLQMERESAEISGALLELSEVMTRARSSDAVLDDALAAIPPLLHCEEVQAWVRDEETGDFRMARSRGMPPEARDRLAALVIPGWVGSQVLASAEGPFVVPVEVIEALPQEFPIRERARPVLCAPLRWEPDGLAIIAVVPGHADRMFSERDLRLVGGLADIASLALGNAGRFTELERAYVSTIEALANALEAKDEYTGDHARALAEMAMAVGTELGLSGERLKMLELAALFHDIGKIGVPSEIIRKPGPLTAGERTIIRRHPEIGEQILAPVPFLQPIRRMVRACHERWDGKGYPDGLFAESIPLEARIVFVCDAYHAMTTDRPYRAALPETEAVRRLRRGAGKQFDPQVVAAFVGLHARGGIHRH